MDDLVSRLSCMACRLEVKGFRRFSHVLSLLEGTLKKKTKAFLGEQDNREQPYTQGEPYPPESDSEDFSHMRMPGEFPRQEEFWPEMEMKNSDKREREDSGSTEGRVLLEDLLRWDKPRTHKLLDHVKQDHMFLYHIMETGESEMVEGFEITPDLADQLFEYLRDHYWNRNRR